MESNLVSDFKIHDRVISKQTGLPVAGSVVALFCGRYYAQFVRRNSSCNRWDELYPRWKDNLVAIVLFDTPMKNLTKEEYCNGCKSDVSFKGITQEEAEILYKYTVPLTYVAYYPIEDLEILE